MSIFWAVAIVMQMVNRSGYMIAVTAHHARCFYVVAGEMAEMNQIGQIVALSSTLLPLEGATKWYDPVNLQSQGDIEGSTSCVDWLRERECSYLLLPQLMEFPDKEGL